MAERATACLDGPRAAMAPAADPGALAVSRRLMKANNLAGRFTSASKRGPYRAGILHLLLTVLCSALLKKGSKGWGPEGLCR